MSNNINIETMIGTTAGVITGCVIGVGTMVCIIPAIGTGIGAVAYNNWLKYISGW
jgi:hypothetical protein